MATHSFSLLSITSSTSNRCNDKFLATSFTGRNLSIRPQNLNVSTLIRTTDARVSCGLSTTNPPESAPSETEPPEISQLTTLQSKVRWSARAINAYALAEMEARKLKHPKIGTESLLLGILAGPGLAAKFLRESGVTLFEVRSEAVKLLGRGYVYYPCPANPPLTKQAQMALDWAFSEKLKSGESGELTTTHIVLGIWSVKESAGHRVMSTLGFDDEKAKELAKFMDKEREWKRK